jgi:uncharacterized protein (TIGR03437 family)
MARQHHAPGALLIVYATGLGAVNQTIDDAAASGSVLTTVNTPPVVTIGGITAQIQFAGLAPQFPGVNQLNVIVPANAPTGRIPKPGTVTLQLFYK